MNMIRSLGWSAVLVGATLTASPLMAQGFGRGNFGSGLAVRGGQVLVSEPKNEITPGAVYVYVRGASGAWDQQAKLVASDAAAGDRFGTAIAADGATLIATATAVGEGKGAVYVFSRDAHGRWIQTGQLSAADGLAGDGFGRAAVLDGDVLLVGAPVKGDSAGAVYAYHRDAHGKWTAEATLQAGEAGAKDGFGAALAVDGDRALITAPRADEKKGVVYAFRRAADGTWSEEGTLSAPGIKKGDAFGAGVLLSGDEAYVGAPRLGRFSGAVFAFRYDSDKGKWNPVGRLQPFDASGPAGFGGAIAQDGSELWIGAGAANGFQGRVYRLHRDEHGEWNGADKLGIADLHRFDFFAGALAMEGSVAVVAVSNDDYGAGTAVVFRRDPATGTWKEESRLASVTESMAAVTGGKVKCSGGKAAGFDCTSVDLLSFLPVKDIGGGRGVEVNDMWGWTDPDTGKEWALVGRSDGTAFIDVSDPLHPRYAGELPKTEGANGSVWRDIKVYKNHAFVVSDAAGKHGIQVFDLTKLRGVHAGDEPVTFTESGHYDKIASAHNIVIDPESGFAYVVGASSGGETCGGGLHMVDIHDPDHPVFAGCFSDARTGRRKTGYTHDAECVMYHGPDADYQGHEICFGANETAISIADVTDKKNPKAITMVSYPNVGYAHQGWLDEDQKYYYQDDELDEMSGKVKNTRTLVWDVSDLDDPILAREYFADTRGIDHNLYVKGDRVYQSNYVNGLRVLDISDRLNPKEIGYFDTVPYGGDTVTFGGSWSNYPFFKSGIVVVTSGKEGVFVVRPREGRLAS